MDHNKEVEKKIKQIREDYKITFGSEEGKRVLEDISIRCHESSTTFSKDNSHETAFLEGQRSISLFIKGILKSK
jgi:hypothetical protein|tara:strand:- start:227 stop:448 length:222 start_codon:yes stop_codon:yes gene_type:complete